MTAGAERAELWVGAAVLAVAAGFLVWSVGGSAGTLRASYPLVAQFPNVDGIQPGTEVRLAGVRIGRVGRVDLNRQTYLAKATLEIPDDIALPTDTAALIQSDGLLGGSYLELRPGGAAEMLAPGDEIEDVQGAVSLIALMLKFLDSQSSAKDGAATDTGTDSP